MVLLLVILTLVVCLGIEAIRNRGKAAVTEPQVERSPGIAATLERLFHPGHSWAQIVDAQSVTGGVDDFAQRFVGKVEVVDVLESGTRVQQGDALASLRHHGRQLTIVSPVSGVVTETNSQVSARPGIVNSSPYEQGWLAKIRPARLESEIRNLLRGAAAEGWREALQAQMASCFAPRLGMVLQDGGEWVDNLSDLLSDEEWEKLARTLFPLIPAENHKPMKD
jgi:glycine cleavage system H protein